MIMGAIYPATVVMGLHHMYNVIEAGMLSSVGLNTWMPIASAANFAQFGACLAVGLKSQSNKTKVIAVPSALSAALGITEPAIFGVNLRFFKPFIAGCIGGGCGALYASLVHLGAKGTGVTGIFGILLCLNAPVKYILMFAIAACVAFALTWLFGYKDAEPETANGAPAAEPEVKEIEVKAAPAATGDLVVCAPITGTAVTLKETGDETFAAEVLGKGYAIEPSEGRAVAPCAGTISALMGHAIGMECDNGLELLIHIGINTVELDGKHYTPHVQEGQHVNAGDLLMEFDIPAIKKEGYPMVTPVIVTNSDDYAEVSGKLGAIKAMDSMITVKR
ncbi:MAG TPA: hypothetical protein DDX51_04390 [Clostridiales bacterium]|nr:hypothetical protein [Clostridiales bacterium]